MRSHKEKQMTIVNEETIDRCSELRSLLSTMTCSNQNPCAGPTGKILLLPSEPNAVHIMVATGTGIAPYRAYLRRMFMEDVPNYKFTGLAWLFMGVANSDARLYDDEFQAISKKYPKQVGSSQN